jgi:hypothetical protein
MSLDLTLYDDAALEAFAPKGVVRRARRDFEAGLATIKEREAKAAVVEADGETVRLDARGPKTGQCTCPATGICRHILLAVMALNAAAPVDEKESSEKENGTGAAEEVCALSQDDVQSFAGADWAGALALATSSAGSTVQVSGRNCAVEIDGSPASVTFLAGLGLKGAAFKGPKTRARLVVAAAALILRTKQGVALELSDEETPPATGVTREYLDEASQKLLHCARMVLAGASPVAADTLFDLAISARAEAAPRLTSQLRSLTKQAGQAAQRVVHFEPENFLSEAARTYALIEALKHPPTDSALTGVIRRDYRPAPDTELWMLGAVRWSTETGARGLTLHGFAPTERQWRFVTQARGPGMDPTFDAGLAYTMPLWGQSSVKALVGNIVHLPAPLTSVDGAITPTLPSKPSLRGAIPRARALLENGIAVANWGELRRDVALRAGAGLHRRSAPLPALIAPTKFGQLSFDDFTLSYELEALDQFGDAVRLVFSSDAHLNAKRLSEMSRPPLLLAETSLDQDRPALRPVAVLHDGAQNLEVVNLTLDDWPRKSDPASAIDALQALLPRKRSASRLLQDPLADLARRALAEATIVCAGEPSHQLQQLEQQCDAGGLTMLAGAIRRMGAERTAGSALASAYLAGEALKTLSWS